MNDTHFRSRCMLQPTGAINLVKLISYTMLNIVGCQRRRTSFGRLFRTPGIGRDRPFRRFSRASEGTHFRIDPERNQWRP
jgi:hypothetical protein